MKKILSIIFLLISVQSFAQSDTVVVKVRGIPGAYNFSKNAGGDSLIFYVDGLRHALSVGTVVDLSPFLRKTDTANMLLPYDKISRVNKIRDSLGALISGQVTGVSSVNSKTGAVTLTKSDIGLGSVDNTSDISKPISTATQTALNLKANDNAVVKLTGDQSIFGAKTFSLLSMYDSTGFNGINVTSQTPSAIQTLVRSSGGGYAAAVNKFYTGQYTNATTLAFEYGIFGSLPSTVNYTYFGVGSDASYLNNNLRLYPDKTVGLMNVNDVVGNDIVTRNSSGILTRRTFPEFKTDLGVPTTFVDYSDIRALKPNSVAPNKFQFGFGSYNNTGGSPYSDYINFGGYSDGSAGNQNVIMLNRSGIGMRIYQGTFQSSSPYSTYRDVAFQDSVNSGLSGKIAYVPDIPSLLSYAGTSKMVIVQDTLMGGIFNKVTSGLTTDNGIIYNAAGGGFWQRVIKSNEINAEWFGAKGDGVNNDAPAINAVLTKYPGSTLVLRSARTYKVQSSLFLTNGTKIVGNGATIQRDTVPIDINVLSAIPSGAGAGTLVITVDSTNTVEFAKLKLGIQLMLVNREGDARKLDFYYKTITAINGASITLNGASSITEPSWTANTASLVNIYPIFTPLSPDAENVEITGVTIDGARSHYTHHRIYWEAGETIDLGGTENALVSNCFIKNSLTDGISAAGGVNTRIMHNRIWWSGGGAIHLSGSEGTVVDGNYLFDCNSNQYSGHNEGAIIFSNWIWHTKIVNNLIDVCLRGIGSIDSPDNGDITIADNTFRRYSLMGIHALLAIADTLKNVNITGNHFYGAVPITSLEAPYLPTPIQTISAPTYGGVVVTAVDSTGMDTTSTFYNINITANIFENASAQINHVKRLNFSSNTFIERNAIYNATSPYLINLGVSTGLFTGNTIIEKNTPARKVIFFTSEPDMVISNNSITSDIDITDANSLHTNFFNNKVTGGNVTVVNGFNIRNNDMTGNIYSAYITGGALPRDIVSNKANTIAIAPGDTGTIIRDNNVTAILDSGVNTLRVSNIINGVLEVDTVNLKAPLMYDSTTKTQYISQGWIDSLAIKNYVAKSTDYTATSTDKIIEVTATGTTQTLPTAAGIKGKEYEFILTAAGTATVATTSSQTINGATTYSLSAQYKYVTVISNGTNWIITGNN